MTDEGKHPNVLVEVFPVQMTAFAGGGFHLGDYQRWKKHRRQYHQSDLPRLKFRAPQLLKGGVTFFSRMIYSDH